MRIHEMHVKNFRSILDEALTCSSLTALVGRNGSGKSSFLSALELFYEPSPKITTEEFYSENVSKDIEIAITFGDLNSEAKELFQPYIEDEYLTVVRVFSDPQAGKSGTYHGTRLQNPDFTEIRNAGGNMPIRNKYNEIRKREEYSSLPSAGSADAVRAELTKWESQHPENCSRIPDDGQFFGFTQVGQGYLGRHTKFVLVPAVRNAQEDATEGRGSPVTEILNLVVRSVIENRKELAEFKLRTQEQYREIMDPDKLPELNNLADDLSRTLKYYVPDASVLLQWSELSDIPISMPGAQVKLIEDEYESYVDKKGHGLQRAFIVTMLQHLLAARDTQPLPEGKSAKDTGLMYNTPPLPNLVLAIEEPELYQHPSRQRYLASVLLKLATGAIPGVAKNTQVIYATHSPLFVGLDRFDQIRVLRKTDNGYGQPKATRVKKADMDEVATELWESQNKIGVKFTADTLRPRLHALMTPWMNEGFFADLVVLVEGEGDRAAMLGAASMMNCDLDGLGITVIPCFGKQNLDRPLVIFRQLGIPVYVVWDGDCGVKDSKPENNRYLMRLVGECEEDWPDYIGHSSACFKVNMEKTLESEIGPELFDQLLLEAKEELGIVKKDHALKNPAIIERVLTTADAKGKTSASIRQIVERVIALNK